MTCTRCGYVAGLPDGIFIPEMIILVHCGRPWDRKFWYISWPFGILHIALWGYFMAIFVFFAIFVYLSPF
jgi:hypothetical protein